MALCNLHDAQCVNQPPKNPTQLCEYETGTRVFLTFNTEIFLTSKIQHKFLYVNIWINIS